MAGRPEAHGCARGPGRGRHLAGSTEHRVRGSPVRPGRSDAPETRRRRSAPPVNEDGHGSAASSGVARYARGRDYHRFMRRRIRRLASYLRSLGTAENPVRARPLCDEEPLLERAWAVRAGLGFVGKNGMLIVPGVGSMVLLGEVVTTLELDPTTPRLPRVVRRTTMPAETAGRPASERCGACTRCSMHAHVGVRPALRSRCAPLRLVSHHRARERDGSAPARRHRRAPLRCDDCQTVCPFNAGAGARAPLPRDDGDPFQPLERWSRIRLTISFDG